MDQGHARVRLAHHLTLLLIVSLAFMKPALRLLGFDVVGTDLLFLLLGGVVAVALLVRRRPRRWNRGYWLLAAYLAALAPSILASPSPVHSLLKFVTIGYLALLAVLVDQTIDDEDDLRRCLGAWAIGSLLVAAAAVVALAAFAIDPRSPLSRSLAFAYGTLPPGPYPRFSLTFYNGNMLCNYLTVSIGALLAAHAAGWIDRRPAGLLLIGLLVAGLFTISPGLGGILLLLGVALWRAWRRSRPGAARFALAGGIVAAGLFVVATAITPILHPTAPFLIHLGGWTLAPAGRLMTWMSAARTFAAHPLFGGGIGIEPAHVRYLDPTGDLQLLTDAHNTFLSIAGQAGIVGLAGLFVLLAGVVRRTRAVAPGRAAIVRTTLGLTFLVAFGYEGLGGSYEDARHLWVLLGLVLAADRLARPRPVAVRNAR